MAAAPAKPAEEVPAEFKEDVAKLQKPLAAILAGKKIPWAIQAALGASGYVTVDGGRPGGSLEHPGEVQWSPGPGIPGWREWVQRQDLDLHGDAPISGSSGGSQLGVGGQPGGPGGPDKGSLGGPV